MGAVEGERSQAHVFFFFFIITSSIKMREKDLSILNRVQWVYGQCKERALEIDEMCV